MKGGRLPIVNERERYHVLLGLSFLIIMIVCLVTMAHALPQVRISVFNFATMNMESSGYGTAVTNILVHSLKTDPSLDMLDRKELEAFLSLNDLQQDDRLENVVNIGTRLGLNVIVVGNVEKKDAIILVNCKVVLIEQKRIILNTRLGARGDTGLAAEINKLTGQISEAISKNAFKTLADEQFKAPVHIQKRPGNKQIQLSWEDPGANADGYEVFRSTSQEGPFAKIARVNQHEYLDQDLEKSTPYYYKIRAFRNNGFQSGYSEVIAAETALTPNPPMIIKVEAHVKSVRLMWLASPVACEDPLKLKGYKLYRTKTEGEPYREVVDLSDTDLGATSDSSSDKLLRVIYLDKNLADGETYYYKLTAYNEKKMESGFSGTVKGSVLPVVGGLSAQGDMIREVKLVWNAINSAFVTGYIIYRSLQQDADFKKIKKLDTPVGESGRKVQYSDQEGLGEITRYYYRVTAFEEPDQETAPSAVVSAVTKGKPPGATDLKAKSGLVKKVELSWTANPQEEVKGYTLFWSKEKTGKFFMLKRIEGRMTGTFIDKSRSGDPLEDNRTYYYAVKTYNRVDVDSDLSEIVAATTKPRPAKPSGLKGETMKMKSAPLAWLANPEKDIVYYRVFRKAASESGNFSDVAKVPAQETRYLDKDLKDGVTYLYKIQAEDGDGLLSDFSDEIMVQIKPRPKSPEQLSGDFQTGSVELKWRPGPEPDIAYYRIYEKSYWSTETVPGADKVTSPSVKFKVVLEKGKKKTYVVTSVDKDGLESEYSQEITVTGK